MAKYQIEWTEEVWKRIVVEDNSKENAWNRFLSGEFDEAMSMVEPYGGETQDSVEIEEVE